jgi:predicted alpha/beta-hydrolase family hydrolase
MQIDALRATGIEGCHILGSPVHPAGVASKLIDQSSSGDPMQCTFNWAKFLSSVISGSPLLDTTACALMWSARGRLSARINWLSCDDRRTPPPGGRQAERGVQDEHTTFLCRQICHAADICLTCQNLKCMKIRQARLPISRAF